jgi:hypothetical protein
LAHGILTLSIWCYVGRLALLFGHRTSQEGDTPPFFSHPFRTTAPIRSRFYFQSAYFPLAKRPNHLFCSVPVIPLASSRAGLSVSASLFLIATVTGCIVLSSAIGTRTQKATFYCVLMLAHQSFLGVTHEKVASYLSCVPALDGFIISI